MSNLVLGSSGSAWIWNFLNLKCRDRRLWLLGFSLFERAVVILRIDPSQVSGDASYLFRTVPAFQT
jgi:hypothetical protein